MRILLLTQYYAPEPVDKFTDLARGLRERGHEVEVITGFPCYPHGQTYKGYRQAFSRVEMVDGVRVIRVPQAPDHSRNVVRRALYYLSFAFSAATIGLFRSRKADVVLAYQSALPTGLAAWWISRAKRIPYLLDVADLWPESVVASGMLRNRAAVGVLRQLAKFVYAGAVGVNVITEGYRRNLLALGVSPEKLRLIHSWPAVSHRLHAHMGMGMAPSVRREEVARFTALYAGAIGPCQQLETIVDAALLLKDDPRIEFVIAGEGVARLGLEQRAKSAGADNVRFLGWQSPQNVAQLAADADMLLVHLKPDAMSRLSIPSKTFACMASGRPLLMAVEGEAAELVTAHGCGVTCAPSNAKTMADAIRRFSALPAAERAAMGAAGRTAFEQHFSPEVQIDKVVDSLRAATEIVDRSSDPPLKRAESYYSRYGKRLLDLSLAIASLVALLPVLAFTAVLVRVTLGRPVVFKQRRAGRNGTTFDLVKFRTMTDARGPQGQLLPDAQRLTQFGRLLRSTSLDELPELWNVIRGEMSLVGPRPLLTDYLRHYTAAESRRHAVRPGLTGLAQVRGRNGISWRRRLRYDAWYVARISLALDVRILLGTLGAVLWRRGIAADGHATMPRLDAERGANGTPVAIYVIGAGGHGKVAVRAALASGIGVAGVFDDDPAKVGQSVGGAPVLGAVRSINRFQQLPTLIAIGDNRLRLLLAEQLDLPWATVIHPAALVDATATIGRGALVLAGAVVQADATVGEHAIVNDNATVEHDCIVERGAHVACGACLAGGAAVGEGALIGAGAVLLPRASVGDWATVGAGAVVLHAVPAGATAVGNPARLIGATDRVQVRRAS